MKRGWKSGIAALVLLAFIIAGRADADPALIKTFTRITVEYTAFGGRIETHTVDLRAGQYTKTVYEVPGGYTEPTSVIKKLASDKEVALTEALAEADFADLAETNRGRDQNRLRWAVRMDFADGHHKTVNGDVDFPSRWSKVGQALCDLTGENVFKADIGTAQMEIETALAQNVETVTYELRSYMVPGICKDYNLRAKQYTIAKYTFNDEDKTEQRTGPMDGETVRRIRKALVDNRFFEWNEEYGEPCIDGAEIYVTAKFADGSKKEVCLTGDYSNDHPKQWDAMRAALGEPDGEDAS